MENKDLYQSVTDQIIEFLEKGGLSWDRGWNKAACMPFNLETGNLYKGINTLILWSSAFKNGFKNSCWLTFKQAKKMGGNIKKGSKGTTCTYFEVIKKTDGKTQESIVYPMIKKFTVFNIDQVEGVTYEAPSFENTIVKINEIEQLKESLNVGVTHSASLKNPCYSPSKDEIFMPNSELFQSTENYYATLLHEMTHATGHNSRLNRDLTSRFGSSAYAVEELIAELGSSFACANYGLLTATIENHAAYLDSWLKVLKSDKKAIFKASSEASKAFEFLLGGGEK